MNLEFKEVNVLSTADSPMAASGCGPLCQGCQVGCALSCEGTCLAICADSCSNKCTNTAHYMLHSVDPVEA